MFGRSLTIMFGEFTAMVSWAQIVAFSTVFLESGGVSAAKRNLSAVDFDIAVIAIIY